MEQVFKNIDHNVLKLIKHVFKLNLWDIEKGKQYTLRLFNTEEDDFDGRENTHITPNIIIESDGDNPIELDFNLVDCSMQEEYNTVEIILGDDVQSDLNLVNRTESVILTMCLSSSQLTNYSISIFSNAD
ncbi:MAG: hypothetical protein K2G88_10175 [Oscillospiraceae bacterium]|nr:hypothetical protein [Oscillospiraceae bacterium]